MKRSVLREVSLRLLNESYDYSGLAVYVVSQGENSKSITLYDADKVDDIRSALQALKTKGVEAAAGVLRAAGVAKGYIKISKPKNPCNKAWEVKFSAGPGYGKFIYGAAFDASPTGFLIPDRVQVSSTAYNGWQSAAARDRERLPLDNYKKPQTPPKTDDCGVYGDEVLDAAYSAEGWEFGFMRSAKRAHREVMQMADDEEVSPKKFEAVINLAGVYVFEDNYDPGAVAAWGESD